MVFDQLIFHDLGYKVTAGQITQEKIKTGPTFEDTLIIFVC